MLVMKIPMLPKSGSSCDLKPTTIFPSTVQYSTVQYSTVQYSQGDGDQQDATYVQHVQDWS